MEDSRKKLYDRLSESYNLGTFEEFNTKIGDEDSRKALYDKVSEKYNIGTYDDYSAKLGPTYQAQKDTLETNLADFTARHGDFMSEYESFEKLLKAPEMEPEYLPNYEAHMAQADEYNLRRSEREKMLKEYFSNPLVIKEREGRAGDARLMAEGFAAAAGRMEQDNPELAKRAKAINALNMGPRGRVAGFDDANVKQYNEDHANYDTARRFAEEAQEIYAAPSKYDDSVGVVNFLKGAKNVANSADFWTMGMSGIADNLNARDALVKVQEKLGSIDNLTEDNINQILSPSEAALVTAWAANVDAQARRAEDLSRGYQAGQGATESLGFMAQFLLTGGAGKAASEAATKGMTKWLAGQLGKMAHGAVKTVTKGAAKGVLGTVKSLTKAAVQTPLMPSTYENISEVMLEVDNSGKLIEADQAFWTGLADSMIETWSENAGGMVEEILGVPLKLGKSAWNKALGETSFGKWGQSLTRTPAYNLMKQAGWNGYIGELGEEWLGNSVRTLTGLDPDALKDFATVDQQIITMTSFAPMAVFGLGASAAQYKAAKNRAANAAEALSGVLQQAGYSQDQISFVLDDMNASTPRQLSETLTPVVNQIAKDTGFGSEAFKAVMNYADAMAKYRTLDGFYQREQEAKMLDARGEIEGKTGQLFYQIHDTGKPSVTGDGNVYIEEVRVVENSDGSRFFVVGQSEDGTLAAVDEQGGKRFITEDEITRQFENGSIVSDQTMMLRDFLSAEVVRNQQAAEQARMTEDARNAVARIRQIAQPGTEVNLGTAEAPVVGIVTQVTGDGVVVQTEAGISQLSWEEAGRVFGIDATPRTDEEIEAGEVAQIEATRAERMTRLAQTADEAAGAEIEALDALAEESVAEPLPLKADGSVDQTSLWNQNPERWAEWNDEQRQDGGANSLAYINGAIAREEAAVAELAAAYGAEPDFDTRTSMESQIKAVNERLNRLVALQQKYAPLMQSEAPMAEEASEKEAQPAFGPTEAAPAESIQEADPVRQTLVELYSDEELTESEIEDYINANVKKAQSDLDKHMSKAPKMGTDMAKYKADRAKHQEKTVELEKQRDFWKEVQSYIEVPEVSEMDMEPQDALEFTAKELTRKNGIKLQRDSFARHTGYGAEAGNFLTILRTKANDGLTLEEAGERLMEMDRENNTGFFDQNDPNAGLNAILAVIGGARTSGDISGYIRANREQIAKEQVAAARNAMMEDIASESKKPSGGFEYYQGDINSLVEESKTTSHGLIKKIISPASERLVNDLNREGVEIDANYKHTIDNSGIRHILNNHGTEKEYKRGQIPVTDNDFQLIEDIVNNYDEVSTGTNKRGQVVVTYVKSYPDGTTYYVEEVRVGRKELAADTMYKRKNRLTDANGTETTQISDSPASSDSKDSDSIESTMESDEKVEDVGDIPDVIWHLSDEEAVRRATEMVTTEQDRVRLEEEKRAGLRDRIKEWEQKLGVQVDVMESVDDVTNAQAKKQILSGNEVYGWFNPASGKVVFYLPDYVALPTAQGLSEIDKTYIHEVVSHKGLRGLLGEEKYDELCDRVWEEIMSEGDRKKYLAYPGVNGNQRAAADEYIAHFAETVELTEQERTIWDKIVDFINNLLGNPMTKEDLGDLIRSSYARLAKNAAAEEADSSQKIEDFGEKIGGARKDVARAKIRNSVNLTGKDLKELKDPDKILSRKQIVKYFNEGQMTLEDAQTMLAANMAVRSADTSYKELALTKYRDMAVAWEKGEEFGFNLNESDIDMLYNRYDQKMKDKVSDLRDRVAKSLRVLLFKAYDDYRNTYEALQYPAEYRDLKSLVIQYGTADSKYWVLSSANARRGWPKATMLEAVAYVKNNYPIMEGTSKSGQDAGKSEGDKKETYGHLHVVKSRYGGYRIKSRVIPGDVYISQKEFYSKKTAEAYLKENAERLVERERTLEEALMGSNIGMVERKGEDYRSGKDVTPQDFLDTFGFRGVEFGNWVPQAERQMYLNKTYDAIMDFCKVIGISPKAFTLGGRLAIGFGSRGKSRAMAHYESGLEVINLTRMHGAGSLAHEWFHALDNILAKQKTGNTSDMITDVKDAVREEMVTAFTDFVKKMDSLPYTRRSRRAGEYWGEVWERAARLFENYVYNELGGKGMVSPLLVRKDALYEETAEDFGSGWWPYPSERENAEIKPYFDALFDALQEQVQEDGNIVLYRTKPEIDENVAGLETLVERVYRTTGAFSFSGSNAIESSDDVAYIFRQLEDSAVENSFLVFVKDGVPTILHTGMGNVSSTFIDNSVVLPAYKDYGADKVYMVHNHPSGTLKASQNDLNMLLDISNQLPGVSVEGIIIDTTSGEYGVFDLESARTNTRNMPESGEETELTVLSFDRNVFSPDYKVNLNERKISNAEDVASFLSAHRLGEGSKVGALLLNIGNVINGNLITNENEVSMDNADILARQIAEAANRTGSTSIILFGDFDYSTKAIRQLEKQISKASGKTVSMLDVVRLAGKHTQSMMEETLPYRSTLNDGVRFRMSNENQAIFVSNAAKAVEVIKQEKATPEQWLKMIEKNGGLKAGEDKWMGLSDWLKASDKKTLTKQEVLDFIKENMIQIEEVHYKEGSDEDFREAAEDTRYALQEIYDDYIAESEEMTDDIYMSTHYDYAIQKLAERLGYEAWNAPFVNINATISLDLDSEFATAELNDLRNRLGLTNISGEKAINETRLEYTTQGLTNNHEIALTVPTIESWNERDNIHFGDAGNGRAVAWVRFGDARKLVSTTETIVVDEFEKPFKNFRGWDVYKPLGRKDDKMYITAGTLKDGRFVYGVYVKDSPIGAYETFDEAKDALNKYLADNPSKRFVNKRILVIDEIQSKRHQEGRERGYISKEKERELREKFEKAKERFFALDESLREKYGRDFVNAESNDEYMEILSPEDYREYMNAQMDFSDARLEMNNPRYDAVPDAPFDKNWHELAMKRMLRYAAENGYDYIAWTKGAQQAERYSLTKFFNAIEREDNPSVSGRRFKLYGGNVETFVVDESGKVIDSSINDAKDKQLAEVVGKELAVEMMGMEDGGILDSQDIAVGGEGMKGFYDKMLPSFMNKYGKKWGVKVEDIKLNDLEDGSIDMHSVSVTEEMKASAMEGQVMFRVRGENESAREFIQSVADEVKYAYPSIAPIVVEDITPAAAQRYGMTFDDLKKTAALYYQNKDRIIIFAHDGFDNDDKVKKSVFHESIHREVRRNFPYARRVGKFFWDNSDGDKFLEKIKAHVEANYKEAAWHEEMLCYALSSYMIANEVDSMKDILPDDLKNDVTLILYNIGYGRERKRGKITWKYSGQKDAGRSSSEGDPRLVSDNEERNSGDGLTAEERKVINEYFPGTFPDPIEQARQDVDQNPTEAQKEVGNYKMGHLNLDGYRITIENPKGSVRRGADSKGNAWENTLNNDYGYIRGTEGVDGDHIDVYLSDNPSEGNVFVIDQVNPETREFDEHKVMYGFNSAEEAREAYLANFSEGWNGLGTITEVSKDEFKKWIQSSHRKTKPFSEYKSVNAISSQSEGMEDEVMLRVTGTPTDEVVASGLRLSPAQTADLAGNIFAALPESARAEVTASLNGDILGLQDAIMQIPARLAMKENWDEEDRKMADIVASEVTKIAGEMTRPFSAPEALWLLYDALNKPTDLISEAQRVLVQRNLGFDAETQEVIDDAKDGVRFRTVGDASDNARASMYNKGAVNVRTRLKESFVDMNASVEELVKAMEKASGKAAQGFENVILALNQQSSKGLAAMERYDKRYLAPMLNEVKRIIKDSKMSYEDVVRYVILKHGLERNELFAKRDAREFYNSMFDKVASRMKTQSHAQRVVSLSDAKKALADIESKIASATGKKLERLKEERELAMQEVTIAELVLRGDEKQNETDLKARMDAIDAGTDAKYLELRDTDYSGITSMFYDQLDVNRTDYETEEEYQAALMLAKEDKYKTLADVEAAAQQEVDVFESGIDTSVLWEKINAATKETLRQQYQSNMISKDQYESLRDMFQYYVPLRGFADNTAEDMYTYYRKPNSTGYTKPILAAEGRKTEAESPFGRIAAMAGSAIASNVKNEAKLALFYFVSNRPDNGIATISKTWFEFSHTDPTTGKKVYKPVYPPFTEDLSSDAAKAAYEQWQKDMEAKRAAGQAYESGQRLNLGNSVVNISDTNKPEHVVTVKVGGKDYTILINGNPRAAQAINGDLNIEATGSADYSKVLGPWLRWLSNVNTSYNPEFWFMNMQRDMLFTLMNVSASQTPEYRKKFANNYRKAFKVVSLVAKNEKGALGSSHIENMYKDFVEYGGVTGYTQIKDSETWEKEIERMMNSANMEDKTMAKVLSGTKDVLHTFHRFGESLEQVSRFAAFMTSREMGKSMAESISDAKEITVNFNRKGSGKMISLEETKHLTDKNGQPLNVVERALVWGISSMAPLGRRFIMFFNAAIQGLNAMYRLYKNNPSKMAGWSIGYAAVGIMQALLHGLLDDDDDYLDIPQYERRTALLLGANGVYFKWALPQEARAFYALGELAVETIMGRYPQGLLEKGSVLGQALSIVADVAPINPAEGVMAVVPSQIKPFVELWINKDWKGDPIYNDQKWLSKEEKRRTAKHSSAFKGTGKLYIDISKGLNRISGGDNFDAGLINIQPEKMEHIVQSAFGGTIRTMDKFFNSVIAAIDPDEPVTVRQFPFINRFFTINDERFKNVHVNDVYDWYAGEAEHALTLQKKYKKVMDSKAYGKLIQSDEYRWAQIYSRYKKPIKNLQEQIKVADGTVERMELMKRQDELKRQMIKEISQLP